MTKNTNFPYYSESKVNSRQQLLYRILLYFCLATFFLPATVPLVRADSGNPQPGSGWTPMQGPYDSFHKSVVFTASSSSGFLVGSGEYSLEVWFWQYTGNDDSDYYDYYTIVISISEISYRGILQESEVEVYEDIYEADSGSHATEATWIDASPDDGLYGSTGTVTIGITVPIDDVSFGVSYDTELHLVEVTHETRSKDYPYLLYKFHQCSRALPYHSAFGDIRSDKWMILFIFPDENGDGNQDNPPIDGDSTTFVDIHFPVHLTSGIWINGPAKGGTHIDWNMYDMG